MLDVLKDLNRSDPKTFQIRDYHTSEDASIKRHLKNPRNPNTTAGGKKKNGTLYVVPYDLKDKNASNDQKLMERLKRRPIFKFDVNAKKPVDLNINGQYFTG